MKLINMSNSHKAQLFELINDDCFMVFKNIGDNSVDYTLTSPPYNRKRNDKYSNFTDINKNWLQMNVDAITELLRITKKHIFYNIQANYYNRKDVYKLIGIFSENIVDIHIWQKSNPMPASGNNITNSVEYFLVLGKKSLKSNTTYTKNIITTSVNSSMPKSHKAVMKLEVAEHFILKYTNKDDVVFDCFAGVGTTGIASNKYGRKFIGIEKSPEYYEIALNNLLKQQI